MSLLEHATPKTAQHDFLDHYFSLPPPHRLGFNPNVTRKISSRLCTIFEHVFERESFHCVMNFEGSGFATHSEKFI